MSILLCLSKTVNVKRRTRHRIRMQPQRGIAHTGVDPGETARSVRTAREGILRLQTYPGGSRGPTEEPLFPSHDGSNQLQMVFKEMVKVRKGKPADLTGIENNVKGYRRQTAEMCHNPALSLLSSRYWHERTTCRSFAKRQTD